MITKSIINKTPEPCPLSSTFLLYPAQLRRIVVNVININADLNEKVPVDIGNNSA